MKKNEEIEKEYQVTICATYTVLATNKEDAEEGALFLMNEEIKLDCFTPYYEGEFVERRII